MSEASVTVTLLASQFLFSASAAAWGPVLVVPPGEAEPGESPGDAGLPAAEAELDESPGGAGRPAA